MKKAITLLFAIAILFFHFSAIGQVPILLEDLNPGDADAFDEFNYEGAYLGERIIFPADNGATGIEPFMLENGTISLLKDINEGAEASDPEEFIEFNNKIYFTAFDTENGGAIWATDGTTTEMMIDVSGSTSQTTPVGLVVARSGFLYFSYDGILYKSDGTNQGTEEIPGDANVNFRPNSTFTGQTRTIYEDGVVFLSKKGSTIELWAALDTMSLLGEIAVGSASYDFYGLSEVAAGLAFAASSPFDNSLLGLYIYNNDNSLLGKYELNGSTEIDARRIVDFDEERIIAMVHETGFFVIDGIPGNEIMISDQTYSLFQGEALPYTIVGDYIYFAESEDFFSMTIMKTDGTVNGSSVLEMEEQFPSNFINDGNNAFWAVGTSNNFDAEIWMANPIANTSEMLYKYTEGSPNKSVLMLGIQNERLYYISNFDQDKGREIYYIDLEPTSVLETPAITAYTLDFYNNQGLINSDFNEAIKINCYDLQGRKLTELTTFTNNSFEINLPTNLYLLECIGAHGKIVNKILVKN